MKIERMIQLNGKMHSVVISDEPEALQAARAAGRASIGLWDRKNNANLSAAEYLAEQLEDIDERYLEQVLRRHLGLPWIIGESERLLIREFCLEDAALMPREPEDGEADRVFYTPERLQEYIRCQYGFYQCGIWALIEKNSGRLVGKAGLTQLSDDWGEYLKAMGDGSETADGLEIGYHIFTPYRNRGYGREICQWLLAYSAEEYQLPVYAKIDRSNERSIHLAETCGGLHCNDVISVPSAGDAWLTERRCNGEIQKHNRYVWNFQQHLKLPDP